MYAYLISGGSLNGEIELILIPEEVQELNWFPECGFFALSQ